MKTLVSGVEMPFTGVFAYYMPEISFLDTITMYRYNQ